MLQEFQDNLSSSLVAKKKMVKQELNNSFKTLNAKLEFIFRREQNERKKQYSQYCEIFESCYSQWQKEMDRVEEEDEKLAAMTHKQKEIAVLNRMTQNMAVGTIMSLYETFMQNVESLAENPPPLDESEEQDETS
uniref:synaptonemal complex protein 3-like n=1 Tax=Jaculus jaculus TaxID=51337 RepID=UPI001E1B4296|nr:synaptonemal complex protein 3-like [Jaculus jaculus]XP_044996922.1 synaptonemal complex protein 3-like [Jaculus jaculus]